MGTVISGAQSVDNNVVPVVSSGKNQSVNGQKFGDIMAKSVGGNAGKKNSSTDTLSQNSIRTNTSSSDKNLFLSFQIWSFSSQIFTNHFL